MKKQPLHQVHWIDRNQLHANAYNPNDVAQPELKLLKISILEDGWTQPIVATPNGEMVDGYHRWLVSKEPEIFEMTDGKVPVVFIHPPKDQQMMATIRHNRARGCYGVLKMAKIIRHLIDVEGRSFEEVQERLQMEWEEVDRLYDASGMPSRASKSEFSQGWIPCKGENHS